MSNAPIKESIPHCADCKSTWDASTYHVILCPLHAAAPKMLAALKAVMGADGWSVKACRSDSPEAERARAAIAEAEGQS